MPKLEQRLQHPAVSASQTASDSAIYLDKASSNDQHTREQQLRSLLLASKRKSITHDIHAPSHSLASTSAVVRSRSSSPQAQHTERASPTRRRASPMYDQAHSSSSNIPPPQPHSHPDRRPPRPHVDRWVPPPRDDSASARDTRNDDDRRSYDRRNPHDTRHSTRGWASSRGGGRYFDAANHSEQGNSDQTASEYGAAQWKRLPRDPYASSMATGGGGGGNQGGADGGFFNSRNEQRKSSTVSIWPKSPPHPTLDSDDEREKRKRSSRHKHKNKEDKRRSDKRLSSSSRSHHHHSSSGRHHRSGRHKYDKESSNRHSRSSRSHRDDENSRRRRDKRSRSKVSDTDSASDSDSDSRSDDSRRHHHGSSRSRRHDSEKRHRSNRRRSDSASSADTDSDRETNKKHGASSRRNSNSSTASSVSVGPSLPTLTSDGKAVDPRAYGGALLPGEGSAMASYVQDGKRIPRRGEIGLTSDQIEAYEKAGYVMSGSRHHRMNAVRMRKENQVISAEEKRTMLRLQAEENAKKEREIVSQFKELVDTLQPTALSSK
ncbi:related to UPF0396 protein UM04995 [Melanopsichium pennsylvanicum]|uniref:Related to UPF0396 protein UM04995 n=2 Tax=Melanopsichium pennsylvanicum TaxID=63383 RepID=A0AAJ5C709_9BASI|nr:uncharacterized protein BN887_05245 [Melanopsichium pennsylvanicum 4]SNX86431.1 related to UPF0396 protein UM04995 [Melanopsichium pennsylvanicum]